MGRFVVWVAQISRVRCYVSRLQRLKRSESLIREQLFSNTSVQLGQYRLMDSDEL